MSEFIKKAWEMRDAPAPRPRPVECSDPQAAVEAARSALASAEAALAAKTEREALAARIDADCKLAGATTALLHEVVRLRVHGLEPQHSTQLAQYRKELSALAESYGVRIVLVGDKTAAMLVLA